VSNPTLSLTSWASLLTIHWTEESDFGLVNYPQSNPSQWILACPVLFKDQRSFVFQGFFSSPDIQTQMPRVQDQESWDYQTSQPKYLLKYAQGRAKRHIWAPGRSWACQRLFSFSMDQKRSDKRGERVGDLLWSWLTYGSGSSSAHISFWTHAVIIIHRLGSVKWIQHIEMRNSFEPWIQLWIPR
jgi:hypothetical protein